ncbi:threonine--tRNA ligase [Microlunatus soli]|uniref:Threonine--tRNA ligase n=1 Tax=Microlunatus soli TaxID=630515 RepID=A0A1H2AEW2_9ACTN|nr:threonine--tRNA ligase [Microlunatus soli]SDT44503.1 threonyl-tRNA synthetase [Microlunatus soli]
MIDNHTDPLPEALSSEAALPSSDHRVIGREMGIFASNPLIGSGLPLWLPGGAIIRRELEQYAHQLAMESGCAEVYSPVLAKQELYQRSGHWAKFADDMFPAMDVGDHDHAGDQLVLRPANCPHHALIFASEQRSYRDLPIRYHEMAAMFRAERSGVLSGLSRVRQINLDDTHVFCRPDQIAQEAELALDCVLRGLTVLGVGIDHLRLSLRDDGDGYLGDDDQWRDAQDQLRGVLDRVGALRPGLQIREAAGEAAFYGPKIDVQVLDARGHQESLATVQVDFNQPERFGLKYVDADGSDRGVIMVHRGVLGAMERMVGFLLEIHDGRLPLWLAPVQLCLLPVHPDHHDHVRRLADRMTAAALRARVESDGTLGRRIRAARKRRDAVLGVVGDAERAADTVSIIDPRADISAVLRSGELIDILGGAASSRAVKINWPQ